MMMSTDLAPVESALPDETIARLAQAFGLDDLSAIDVDSLDADACVTLAYALDQQHARAAAIFAALCEPVRRKAAAARGKVLAAIPQGATRLPHETFVVELKQAMKRDKRIDVLRLLERMVPAEELRTALFLDQPPPEWKADLRKLDTLARRYGGEIAETVERGSPSVAVGAPHLVIEPRESVLHKADG